MPRIQKLLIFEGAFFPICRLSVSLIYSSSGILQGRVILIAREGAEQWWGTHCDLWPGQILWPQVPLLPGSKAQD